MSEWSFGFLFPDLVSKILKYSARNTSGKLNFHAHISLPLSPPHTYASWRGMHEGYMVLTILFVFIY